ncbi:MAG TPA: Flp1 family type IVb pilin [Clostridia bacterium]|nr:Flp1 family type IVb pilin [Clostridia bacterium]
MKKKREKPAQLTWQGLGTIEVVIIIAVLIAVALLFRREITSFAEDLMESVFDLGVLSPNG